MAEQDQLRRRLAEISDALLHSPAQAVKTRVVKLFSRYPSARGGMDAEVITAAYVTDLQPYPLWAIDAACIAFLRGKCSGSAFPPSAPELVAECRAQVVALKSERHRIERILSAEIYHEPTEAERAKVRSELDALMSELRLSDDLRNPRRVPVMEAAKSPDEALADLAQRMSASPVTLSEAAAHTMRRA